MERLIDLIQRVGSIQEQRAYRFFVNDKEVYTLKQFRHEVAKQNWGEFRGEAFGKVVFDHDYEDGQVAAGGKFLEWLLPYRGDAAKPHSTNSGTDETNLNDLFSVWEGIK